MNLPKRLGEGKLSDLSGRFGILNEDKYFSSMAERGALEKKIRDALDKNGSI